MASVFWESNHVCVPMAQGFILSSKFFWNQSWFILLMQYLIYFERHVWQSKWRRISFHFGRLMNHMSRSATNWHLNGWCMCMYDCMGGAGFRVAHMHLKRELGISLEKRIDLKLNNGTEKPWRAMNFFGLLRPIDTHTLSRSCFPFDRRLEKKPLSTFMKSRPFQLSLSDDDDGWSCWWLTRAWVVLICILNEAPRWWKLRVLCGTAAACYVMTRFIIALIDFNCGPRNRPKGAPSPLSDTRTLTILMRRWFLESVLLCLKGGEEERRLALS